MKKIVEVYVSLINKLLDLIVKICNCDTVTKILNNKIIRKIAPWAFIVKVIAIIALVISLKCKSKGKCSKKKNK